MTGELQFIDMIRGLAGEGARDFADDAAVIAVGGETLVLTHDMMVEGRHWPADADPADVAWKLVAVNLSDLAAKGARPIALLLGFTLGDDDWDRRFAEGLGMALAAFGAPLLGGDTVGAGAGGRSLGLTAIGRASEPVPARSGARAGDALYVCGAIGDAMAGHALGKHSADHPALHAAFHRPMPLLEEGAALAPHVHAMMDISDGLLLDASRMADASGLTVDIERDAVPMSEAFTQWLDGFSQKEAAKAQQDRLSWGDDYALLFAASVDAALPVEAVRVGRFVARGESRLLLDGAPVDIDMKLGYAHES